MLFFIITLKYYVFVPFIRGFTMKKISLIFIISAMFFYTACGGNSKNSEKEENPDSTNIVIDEDESTFDADLTDTEESDNDIEADDTETDNDTETEPTNDNDKETSTDSDDMEYVAENCEIDESYTVSSFSEYFTLKSIFVLNNNINGTRDTTANLYLENSDYSFESDKVYDMSEAESNAEGLNVYTRLYYAPLGNVLVPTLSVSAEITNDQISSGEKDENGRITVESAPNIVVYHIDYYEEYESENAWNKRCLIAINKNMLSEIKNGRVQLCPGEKGTFKAQERIKVGIDAEVTSKEEDLLAYINRDRTPEDPDYARSPEDLCTVSCEWSGAEMNNETGKCECPEGTYFTHDLVSWTDCYCKKY